MLLLKIVVTIIVIPTLPALPFDYGYGPELDHLYEYAIAEEGVSKRCDLMKRNDRGYLIKVRGW